MAGTIPNGEPVQAGAPLLPVHAAGRPQTLPLSLLSCKMGVTGAPAPQRAAPGVKEATMVPPVACPPVHRPRGRGKGLRA